MLNVKTLLTVAVLWLCAASGYARELYYERPIEFAGGSEYADSLPDGFITCDYHFRVELPRKASLPEWGLRLIYCDGSQTELVLRRNGSSAHDADFAAPIEVSVKSDKCHMDYIINDRIDQTMDGWSVKLFKRVEDGSLRCMIGQREPLLDFDLPSDGLKEIVAFANTTVGLSRLSLYAEAGEHSRQKGRFDSIGQLNEYLAGSVDRSECHWRYLDRNTDQRRLNTGGDYRLATVRRDDGSIELIYLGGARVNADRWQPMMVKALLLPTAFADHYDLIWYDAFGRAIKADASADIIDGSILRINLPLQGGSVRYQRDIMPSGRQNL